MFSFLLTTKKCSYGNRAHRRSSWVAMTMYGFLVERDDVQKNFSISPTVGGCELGGLRSSSPSQG